MSEREKTIIPLEEAHEIFSMFGIGGTSRGYQRWRRDDGFRQVDFEDVLNESSSVLDVDWRDWLRDAIDVIVRQLEEIGISVVADLGKDGNEGVVIIDEKAARIKYLGDDEDNFDRVVEAVNSLMDTTATYRKFRSCEGSDGWRYCVLKNTDWKELDTSARATVTLLFV